MISNNINKKNISWKILYFYLISANRVSYKFLQITILKIAKTNDCYSHLQDGMSLLQFTPTVEDEGKFLVCRAENPKLPEAGIEDRWKLQVHCKYQSDDDQ